MEWRQEQGRDPADVNLETVRTWTLWQTEVERRMGAQCARREVRCDQEVHNRTLVTPCKVCEEVSKKETRNHFEPCDVQVSLPRRADE